MLNLIIWWLLLRRLRNWFRSFHSCLQITNVWSTYLARTSRSTRNRLTKTGNRRESISAPSDYFCVVTFTWSTYSSHSVFLVSRILGLYMFFLKFVMFPLVVRCWKVTQHVNSHVGLLVETSLQRTNIRNRRDYQEKYKPAGYVMKLTKDCVKYL